MCSHIKYSCITISPVLQVARLFKLINMVTTVWLEIFED